MTPRERILATAAELFYAQGVRATGIDLLIARSEVAKATFYKHFPTKDALIVAFLEQRDAHWRQWLQQTVERLARNPAQRPIAIFDALGERFRHADYRGCAFGNTIAELADSSHAAHAAAQHHKHAVVEYIAGLLSALPVTNRKRLATQLMLLIDGAVVTAVREGGDAAASAAKSIAAVLLERASSTSSRKRH